MYMITGVIVALSGKRYAYIVGPVFCSVFMFEFIWITAWANDWLENTAIELIILLLSFVSALLVGEVVKKHPNGSINFVN